MLKRKKTLWRGNMESATPYIIFFCGIGIIGSFFIGFMVGWFGNDMAYAFLDKAKQVPLHPEMFDQNGNILPDEILAVRFENDYDSDEDYDDEQKKDH
jgi:hypothetical protein